MSNEKLKIAVSYHFTLLSKCIIKMIKKYFWLRICQNYCPLCSWKLSTSLIFRFTYYYRASPIKHIWRYENSLLYKWNTRLIIYWGNKLYYIPLTVLRAAGPKQVKVILIQFIDPNDQPKVLFVFYYFLNNKVK